MTTRLWKPDHRLDGFVVCLLATVAVASLVPAHGSSARFVSDLAAVSIVALFFLYGARMSAVTIWRGMRQWQLHSTILLCTFVLFPILGIAFRSVSSFVLPSTLTTGLVFLSLLPSTIQSSVAFTSIAKGNVAAAICSSSLSNLLGVTLTPALAALTLGSRVNVSIGSMLRIVGELVVPFVVGQLCRPLLGALFERHSRRLALLDRGVVLVVVYSAFSAGVVAGIWHQATPPAILAIFGLDAALLAIALAGTWFGSQLLGFTRRDRIVIVFCGSKKSIASGIPIAAVLFPRSEVSLFLMPAMIYHQMQLMTCALVARRFESGSRSGPLKNDQSRIT